MITLSTHVLDSATGRPAAGMAVTLQTAVVDPAVGRGWVPIGSGLTDVDGRLRSWGDTPLGVGSHRLVFDTEAWFAGRGQPCFYPEVIITFAANDGDSHYHVPLLLAAFAYSTYRGS